MSRLPTVGGDDNTWGNILNDFLSVEHNPDGSLANVVRPTDSRLSDQRTPLDSSVTDAKISGTLSESKITNLTTDLAAKVAKGDFFYNVKDYGAVGNGSTDDTAAIQSAYNAAAASGGVVYFPRATYGVSATINVAGASPSTANGVVTQFAGRENVTRLKCLSDIAGPVLNCAPAQGTQQPSFEFRNVYIDMQLAPSATGILLSNLILAKVVDCKMRSGSVGFQLTKLGASDFIGNWVYNSVIGFNSLTGTGTAGNGNNWVDCMYYMTTGATTDATAGFLDNSQQQDSFYVNCRVQRNPSATPKLSEGFVFEDNTATPNTGSVWLVNCNADGISNETLQLTYGAFRFKNQQHIRLLQCWASNVGSGSNKGPAVILDGCIKSIINQSYLSGRGVVLANTCSDNAIINNVFPGLVTSDPAIRLSGATVTNLTVHGNMKLNGNQAWFDSPSAAQTAQPPVNRIL